MFFFIVLYSFFFLPGLINDMRLVKSIWVLDEFTISMALACCIYNGYTMFLEHPLHALFGILIGLQIAGLERFFVGWFFHSIDSIERWHNLYHDQLLRRLITKEYYVTDHILELWAYCVISVVYSISFIIIGLDNFAWYAVWLGILLEHHAGLKIRLRIQYGSIKSFDGTPFCSFIRNAFVFYWFHIVHNPQRCLGFSTPWFDTQNGTNPFQSKWTFSSPLPFVDFFFVNYTDEYKTLLETITQKYPDAKKHLPDVYHIDPQ